MFRNPLKLLLNMKKQKWIRAAMAELEENGFVNMKKPLSMADRELLNKAVKEREDYINLFEIIPYPEIFNDKDEYREGGHEVQLQ